MKAEDELALGRIYVRQGKTRAALKRLHLAFEKYTGSKGSRIKIDKKKLEAVPAELLSYYGFCIAIVEGRVNEGVILCQKAVSEDMLRSDFYLNLGKVYFKANQKAKALEIFRKGLEVTDQDGELAREFVKFGIRDLPVLKLLSRKNFLNRVLGMIRKQILKKDRKKK